MGITPFKSLSAWLLLVLGRKISKRQSNCRFEDFSYVKNRALLSPAERSFLHTLDQAAGEEYRVFCKVRVADVIDVRAKASPADYLNAFNPISAKHFDFVLCEKDSLAISCVIELNDASHEAPQREPRDAFLDGVCRSVALPLVQMNVRSDYSIPELRERLRAVLVVKPEAKPAEPEAAFSMGSPPSIEDSERSWTLG